MIRRDEMGGEEESETDDKGKTRNIQEERESRLKET